MQEASKKAGISNATASRYFHNDEFKKKLKEYQQELTERNLKSLEHLLGKANKTLSKILDTGNNNQKLEASRIIYQNAFKSLELEDIQNRLEVLEQYADINDN